jgi:hypothetical protein
MRRSYAAPTTCLKRASEPHKPLPWLQVMGIEDMTVEMQAAPYRGHFQEDGFNGVAFSNAFDCFARNLRVKNAGKWANPGGAG